MPKKISALTTTTPADADSVPIVDDSATETRRVLWSVIKSTLKTYFDTLYAPIGGAVVAETPTGTVDGSNTSFSAVHSPLYILVDGLIRPRVSTITDIGGNGFTVTGSGPYTITTNSAAPPVSYIYSYYNA